MKPKNSLRRLFFSIFIFIVVFIHFPSVSVKAGNSIPGVDMQKITNELEALKFHGRVYGSPAFSTFTYTFSVISANDYQAQKPSDAFAFDAGFVAADGTISISEPSSVEQKAVFPDLTSVALYYLDQAYVYHYYQTRQLPLLFKIGFPLFEAGLLPSDATIKTAVNAYGGTFSSFDVLNNRATFITNNGMAVAGAFAEFMSVFKNWGYPMITTLTANGFDVLAYWSNVDNLAGLLGDFNRYVYHRFLQPDDNLRIRMVRETDHLKFYTRPYEVANNFPMFPDSMEAAYKEYSTHFKVNTTKKLSCITLSGCIDAEIEGFTCDPTATGIGGTAWSSGLHLGCVTDKAKVMDAIHLGRHELGHSFQGFIPFNNSNQWLMEGFAFFCDGRAFNADYSNMESEKDFWRQMGISSLERGTTFFGRRPTYEDTKIYPGYQTDYGYKYLGWFLVDYQFRRGGYDLVKNAEIDDVAAYKSLGYTSAQAFMDDFYFDFDTRVRQLPIATLVKPVAGTNETNSTVSINWTPLSNSVKLNVYVSVDEMKSWTKLVDRTTSTTCTWNAGDIISRFYIKISAPDNLDVSTTYGPFQKLNLAKLSLSSLPAYLITGDTAVVKWATTNVQNIKIDCSSNGGTSWSGVNSSYSTSSGQYKWVVPESLSGNCQLKITDLTSDANNSVSEVFTVLKNNLVGGPYLMDKNTLLLLHFDNDLNNRSNQVPNPKSGNISALTAVTAGVDQLGRSYKAGSVITLPHCAALNLTGDWTIEAWVKINTIVPNQNNYLIWKPGDADTYQTNYALELNPWWNNVFHGYYFPKQDLRVGVLSSPVTVNEWYHVAFIRDIKNAKIRIVVHDKNRKQIYTNEQAYTEAGTFLSSRDLQIGVNLDAYIDEVRISNVVRSFIPTGINDLSREHLTLYPNPTDGILYLDGTRTQGEVQVLDVNGRLLFSRSLSGNSPEKIDLTSLKKGIYFVQVKQDQDLKTEKVVVF